MKTIAIIVIILLAVIAVTAHMLVETTKRIMADNRKEMESLSADISKRFEPLEDNAEKSKESTLKAHHKINNLKQRLEKIERMHHINNKYKNISKNDTADNSGKD